VIMDTMSNKPPSESAEDALMFGGSCWWKPPRPPSATLLQSYCWCCIILVWLNLPGEIRECCLFWCLFPGARFQQGHEQIVENIWAPEF
jgi:hypothetical protein